MTDSYTLTLRRSNITVIVDLPGVLTQKQWDAVGAMLTSMTQAADRLEGKATDG